MENLFQNRHNNDPNSCDCLVRHAPAAQLVRHRSTTSWHIVLPTFLCCGQNRIILSLQSLAHHTRILIFCGLGNGNLQQKWCFLEKNMTCGKGLQIIWLFHKKYIYFFYNKISNTSHLSTQSQIKSTYVCPVNFHLSTDTDLMRSSILLTRQRSPRKGLCHNSRSS